MGKLFAALALVVASSSWATAEAPPKGAPTVSGSYTLNWIESCFNSNGTLAGISHTSETLAFNPTTGMATLNGFQAHGEPPVLSPISGSAAYSNTSTTITINGQTYDAFYGKIAKKVASSLIYIGVVNGDSGAMCSDQAQLIAQ